MSRQAEIDRILGRTQNLRAAIANTPGAGRVTAAQEARVRTAAMVTGQCYPFPSTGGCHPTYDDTRGADGSIMCCPRDVGQSKSAMTVEPKVPAWAWVAGGLALGGVALLVLRKR